MRGSETKKMSLMKSGPKQNAGFTLVEVIIAGSLMIILCVGTLTVFRVLLRELALDCIQLGACRLDADVPPETSNNVEIGGVSPGSGGELALCICGISGPVISVLVQGVVKPRWHHTHHDRGLITNSHGLTNDVRRRGEQRDPQVMAQDNHSMARQFIIGSERPSQLRADTKRGEEICGHTSTTQHLRA